MSTIKHFNEPGNAVGDFLIEPLMRPALGGAGAPDFTNMAIDASVTPFSFSYQVPANKTLLLLSMPFYIVGAGCHSAHKFGQGDALATGCELGIMDTDGVTMLTNLMGTGNLQTNKDFSRHSGFIETITNSGSGIKGDSIYVIWDFNHVGGLHIPAQQYIMCKAQDDISSLATFRCFVRGILFNA